MTLDPTELTELVDWRSGLINPRIFIDEEIYRLELEKVFGRTWLFLAHDSMLPKKGDFVSTYMGGDPVVIARQRDGSVRAFLNVCRHRGMKVCRAEDGNAKVFMCPYHGWTYDVSGALASVPQHDTAYLNQLDRSKWGLVPIRLDSYKGFWFGNFDPSAPDLHDYLGDMAWYLDSWVDHAPGGIEFLPGCVKWTIHGNWKTAAEQFAGDSYHTFVSHASSQMNVEEPEEPPRAGQYASPQGHGVGFGVLPPGARLKEDPLSEYNHRKHEASRERFGDLRSEIMQHFTVFPNFSGLGGYSTLGVWHPKGPNEFEIWRYTVVEKDAPAEVREHVQRSSAFTDGAAGTIEMDDGENWDLIGELLERGFQARKVNWNYTMGLGQEVGEMEGFPGYVTPRAIGEMPQRVFYKRWLELMQAGEEWPEPAPLEATPLEATAVQGA